MPGPQETFRFDVAFSFAGPHRDKVRAIAEIVAQKLGRERVFFDEWYEHEILGSDMDVLLQSFYHSQSLMAVADLSEDYAGREWTQAEARAIRALRTKIDTARDETLRLRLLNIRLGDGEVPGVFGTEGSLDGIKKTPEQCAEVILKRHALLVQRIAGASPPSPAAPVTQSPIPPFTASSPPVAPPILFFHPATNDEFYSCREKELRWLDDCAKDTGIRIATITGMGGLGKTSLVGHWISVHASFQHRPFRGVFFFSFYSNCDPQAFFDALLGFVCEREGLATRPEKAIRHTAAANLIRQKCYLIVIDGLEVLQCAEEDPHYGWIDDHELTEFVARVGGAGTSLVILTSRFPFPQVTDENPDAVRALELPLLVDAEGADLLARCDLKMERPFLEGYNQQFGGHPLALRIFAGACIANPFEEPETVSRYVRSNSSTSPVPNLDESGLTEDEHQRRRHQRQFYLLLRWIETKLPPSKRRLLQLVALFREPVPTTTLVALATGLKGTKADFVGCDVAKIHSMLDSLVRKYLLQREDSPEDFVARWSAHPIVRDFFRKSAGVYGETALQFADIVAGKGERSEANTVAKLLPILDAIDVLLAASHFEAANWLFVTRLKNGEAFLTIPAPREGLRCARSFIADERRAHLARRLGGQQLAVYLNWAAIFGTLLGETEDVESKYQTITDFFLDCRIWSEASIAKCNLGEIQALKGVLREACRTASESLYYAGVTESHVSSDSRKKNSDLERYRGDFATLERDVRFAIPEDGLFIPPSDPDQERNSRGYRGHFLSLIGNLSAASLDFAQADSLLNRAGRFSRNRFSSWGYYWSFHCYRLGDLELARHIAESRRGYYAAGGRTDNVARCDLILGEIDFADGDCSRGTERVSGALRVFREARNGLDAPDALLTMARLRRAHAVLGTNPAEYAGLSKDAGVLDGILDWNDSAIAGCEEALRIARRSGFLIKQCDSLNLRAVLRLEAGQTEFARHDVHLALEIAERCAYYWGRHEALRRLCDVARALGNHADENHWEEAEKELTAKMKPEIEQALQIERQHAKGMRRLDGKK